MDLIEEDDDYVLIIHGPRRSGKTIMAQQLIGELKCLRKMVTGEDRTASPPQSTLHLLQQDPLVRDINSCPDEESLVQAHNQAREELKISHEGARYVLIIDEVQEIKDFPLRIKSLWDENRAQGFNIRFVLMGSSALLIRQAYEGSRLSKCARLVSWPHWSFSEVREAFGYDLKKYMFFGGYPEPYHSGALEKEDQAFWREMIQKSIIDPSLEKDIIKMTEQIDRERLKSLFRYVTAESSKLLDMRKLTRDIYGEKSPKVILEYLEHLKQAWLIARIPVFSIKKQKEEKSRIYHPKVIALNTALVTAQHARGSCEEFEKRDMWGSIVETAVGAHLYGLGYGQEGKGKFLYYWREDKNKEGENNKKTCEIDYVIEDQEQDKVAAFEVKKSFFDMSKSDKENMQRSIKIFEKRFHITPKKLGEGGDLSLDEFFSEGPERWLEKRKRFS